MSKPEPNAAQGGLFGTRKSGYFGNIMHYFRPHKVFLNDEVEYHAGSRTYIFFTTPEMNLSAENLMAMGITPAGPYPTELLSMMTQDHSESKYSTNSAFMKLYTNLAKESSLDDEVAEAHQAWETFAGKSITYGTSSDASVIGNDFSVVYNETAALDIIRSTKIWMDYIAKAKKGHVIRTNEKMTNNMLDYATSAFILVTEPDGETLSFWCKYTGVFPTAVPYSAIETGNGDHGAMEVTIPYAYTKRENMSLYVLSDFQKSVNRGNLSMIERGANYLTGHNDAIPSEGHAIASGNDPDEAYKSKATASIVKAMHDGVVKYKLKFS